MTIRFDNTGILFSNNGILDEVTLNGVGGAPASRFYSDGSLQVSNFFDEITMNSGSAFFNGTNQYLSITSSAGGTLDLTNKTIFTIEAWIYPTSFSSAESGIISNRSSAGTDGFDLRINPTGTLQFYYTGGSSLTTVSTLSLNTWYHVAFVRNGANAYLFINGVLSATSTTFANGTTTAQAIWIGGSASGGGTNNYFGGYITNLRVLSGTALYTTGFTPTKTTVLEPITNTVLLLIFLGTIADSSANKFTITNNNSVAYSQFSLGYLNTAPCGSVSLNGAQSLTAPFNSGYTFGASQDFTVELWMNHSAHGSSGGIFSCEDSPGSSAGGWAIRWNGGANTLTVELNTLAVGVITSTIALTAGTWNHIALVRSSGVISLYINGVSTGTPITSSVALAATTATLKLGIDRGSTFYTTGLFTNVRIVKGTALYTANFTRPKALLQPITNTTFLLQVASSANLIVDSSTTAATITNNGTATYSPSMPITSFGEMQKIYNNGTLSVAGYFDETQ